MSLQITLNCKVNAQKMNRRLAGNKKLVLLTGRSAASNAILSALDAEPVA